MNDVMFKTPVQEIRLSDTADRMFIKRDDLMGFSFGGNKVRIAWEFFQDMKEKGCDCLVAYGSSRSNMCRALSNLCSRYGIPCYVLTPREDLVEEGTFNSWMVKWFGAHIRFCHKSNVAEGVDKLMAELKSKGYRPYYIFGDRYGKGNEKAAARAYCQAYRELLEYEEDHELHFDRIFLASGTGMTQGGLMAGQRQYGGHARITGISVARPSCRGKSEVARFAEADPEDVDFEDGYVCGGYGLYDGDIESVIRMMMERFGIPLDPTYTGKAFSGMLKYLKARPHEPENILFIHTGGTPLYFDYLNAVWDRKQAAKEITNNRCTGQ